MAQATALTAATSTAHKTLAVWYKRKAHTCMYACVYMCMRCGVAVAVATACMQWSIGQHSFESRRCSGALVARAV